MVSSAPSAEMGSPATLRQRVARYPQTRADSRSAPHRPLLLSGSTQSSAEACDAQAEQSVFLGTRMPQCSDLDTRYFRKYIVVRSSVPSAHIHQASRGTAHNQAWAGRTADAVRATVLAVAAHPYISFMPIQNSSSHVPRHGVRRRRTNDCGQVAPSPRGWPQLSPGTDVNA